MGYDPNDYDQVYETKSRPEKSELVQNGWVLLDEHTNTAGGVNEEPLRTSWARSALTYAGGGLWSGAGREQPRPEPPHEETAYVLGWPKGQKTITEDEAGPARPR